MKKMIRTIVSVLLVVLLITSAMPMIVFAEDAGGTCGEGLNWSYSASNTKLTISTNSSSLVSMYNYDNTDTPWKNYEDDITTIELSGKIRNIGNYAFYGMENLTSVTFNNSLENIGTYEFSYCTSLTVLEFPETLKSIGGFAFRNSGITTLTFKGNSLASAAEGNRQAFKSLKGAEIYVPEGFEIADEEADPGKYGSLPFFDNYVGFTDGSNASVYWKDYDGIVLKGESVAGGLTPAYDGALPATFEGWDPQPSAVSVNTIYYYTATYSATSFNVTAASAKHGTVTADKDTANYKEKVTLTVTPDADCVVTSVSVNGSEISPVGGVYSFDMPAEDVTVTAVFDFDNDFGAKLAGHTLSLEGDIGVSFYMELSDEIIAHKNTAYMHFTVPKDNPDTFDMLVKDAETKVVGDTTYYIFKCSVAAKETDSNIMAQLFDGDKSSKVYEYSVREYADYLLDHQDVPEYAKAATLVRAMLVYGDNAEYYFDKKSAKPDDIDITIPEKYDVSTVHDTLPDYAHFDGSTLSLKSETSLSLYFNSEQQITLTCEGQTVDTDSSGDNYVIRIRNIPAAELNNVYTVKVDDADAVTYSPLTYCYRAQTSTNLKLVNTVKALYLYWDAAYHYFNNISYVNPETDETERL